MQIIVIGGIVGAILGLLLGRRAVRLGMVFLVLGSLPMAALYVYETFIYTKGDTSSLGMLSTIMAILLAPLGFVLIVFGALRGD